MVNAALHIFILTGTLTLYARVLLCKYYAGTCTLLEYNTRSSAGMVFLKVLKGNIGFYLTPPGEWNVLCTFNNTQIAFVIIHFRDIFSLLNISHIKIFQSVILPRLTHVNYML